MDFFSNYFGSLVCIFFCILYIPIGLPLVYRKIKRNYFYGFKIKYTLEDDDIWYEVNELLGKQMVAQGLLFGVIGLVSIFFVKGQNAQLILIVIFFVILLIGIGYSLVTGTKLMNKLAIEKGLKKK